MRAAGLLTRDEARRIVQHRQAAGAATAFARNSALIRINIPSTIVNLPDFAAALSNAERKIRELRKESGYDDPTLMMIVKDEAGRTVLSLPFFPGH